MLFPSKMVEVEILLHDSVKYDVLKTMQRKGFMHITSHNIEDLDNAAPSKEATRIVDYEFRIGKLMEILNLAKKKPSGMLSILNPPPPERFPAEPRDRNEILDDASSILEELEEKLNYIYSRWERISSDIEKINSQMEQVELLKDIPFDLSYLGEGPYVYIVAGAARNIEPLLKIRDDIALWYTAKGKKKNMTYILVLAAHMKDKKKVESALRFAGFSEFELRGWEGAPERVIEKMREKLTQLGEEREDILKELTKLRKKYYGRLAVLKDDLLNERIKEETHPKFGKTVYTTVIKGFIPKKDMDDAFKSIERAGRGLVSIKWKDAEGDDVPVKYNNPRFLWPFQALVDMYSTPKYGYIEPTVIIAPIFIAYFGLTLGDAGYGFIIAVLGYLLWFRIGKYDWTNRTLGKILFVSGISAIIFGIIQGGIFGPLDSNNPLSRFISYEPLLDPMKNAVYLLTIALVVGIAQISLGLILGAYHHLKHKNYGDFLTSELSWFFLLPSGGLVIGLMFNWWTVESNIATLAWIGVIIGLVLLTGVPGHLVDRKSDYNPMAFFDITGMVGDWLSFSRLLALDLGTSGIALTINLFAGIMSGMITSAGSMVCCMPLIFVGIAMLALVAKGKDKKKTGIALFLLVFGLVGMVSIQAALWLFIGIYMVVAHIGNALLQSLGSLVHSLRLQYVEFFSKFYEGDGVKFMPFREVRKNSKIVSSGGVKR